MFADGYIHILSLLDISADLPYEIIPNHFLRRASKEEGETIGSLMAQVAKPRPFAQPTYEFDITEIPGDKPSNRQYSRTPLPPEHWRYWIIEYPKTNSEIVDLVQLVTRKYPN